ncbi:AIM24 family protein [Paenalkalicoccus suaedae]|uniref:AIM24 family protein n=1 Tax=Paenalkalicoccus suaedae TaxID=2592382 RepID=A0A859FCQ8_9BACI|nr:AIM24 family protein [Paenalkalicoccus suaedae]QKS70045.1 AIM24 family protein [Paenalkalicoccus suaedae]
MSDYTVREFIQKTKRDTRDKDAFDLQTDRILEVNLTSSLWAKIGSMISYTGDIKFTREGVFEHGVSKMLKKSFTSEGEDLMKAEGRGTLFLADDGKKITILELENDQITINGNDILAFEPTIEWDIKLMRKLAGAMSGGLFNIELEGYGKVAMTTHYEPLTLIVEPGKPVMTDPGATVAWSTNLKPEFRTDVSVKTFLGRGSGESIQMEFEGDGFVIVQSKEE